MYPSQPIGRLFGIGLPLLIVALLLQAITVAGGDYRAILIVALLLAVAADACFVTAFIRGGFAARCAAIVLILATVFVVADIIRRTSSFS